MASSSRLWAAVTATETARCWLQRSDRLHTLPAGGGGGVDVRQTATSTQSVTSDGSAPTSRGRSRHLVTQPVCGNNQCSKTATLLGCQSGKLNHKNIVKVEILQQNVGFEFAIKVENRYNFGVMEATAMLLWPLTSKHNLGVGNALKQIS